MKIEGLEAFNKRKKSKSGIYSFEQDSYQRLYENLELIFKSNTKACNFYTKQAPSYQKTTVQWIMSTKQEARKISRLDKLIKASENNNRLF